MQTALLAGLYSGAMRISSPRLRRLDDALAALPAESDAMLLSELDGYLAGVVVCPDLILPGEWLPPVWSSDGSGTPFADEAAAVAGMITLAESARDESDLDRAAIEALTEDAPGLIARWVPTLSAWRLRHCATPLAHPDARRPAKIGRNDPCSCGSGKKYKKCCGLH